MSRSKARNPLLVLVLCCVLTEFDMRLVYAFILTRFENNDVRYIFSKWFRAHTQLSFHYSPLLIITECFHFS